MQILPLTSLAHTLSPEHSSRIKQGVALAVFTVLYLAGTLYHLMSYRAAGPVPGALEAAYQASVVVAYASLWMLFSCVFARSKAAPGRIFWRLLLLGAALLALAKGIVSIGAPPESAPTAAALGFEYGSNRPLTLATVIKMNVLSLLEASFALFLLHRLRDLVLFKRTRSSQRNWRLMIAMMGVAALSVFMADPASNEPSIVRGVFMAPATLLMVANSFRLSWIPYLSFREKMATLGLAALLLTMLTLSLAFGDAGFLPGGDTFVLHYSYPLRQFSLLSIAFGILYCATALLSLLFHLPTTSDFQQKVDEMAALHSLTRLVSQAFDPSKLAASITASPVESGSAHQAWLAVLDVQRGTLRPEIVGTHGIAAGRIEQVVDSAAFFDELALKREPILIEQAPVDHRVRARPGDGLGSLLVVPLVARGELIGALYLVKNVAHGFEEDDVAAMVMFGAQAALALDHARLFEQQIEKERLTRELDIAREVQRKLLPQALPEAPGLDIAASSISAQEVGGDYYDFLELGDDRLALIIGDVSGKGTQAAFFMAEMQGIFRSVSRLAPRPLDFLTHANEALGTALEKHVFVSVVYGLVDLRAEELLLARAGHCPVAVINLGGEARFLRSQGIGLGLDRSHRFREALAEERIALQPGDVFVLYTDGLVESRDADGEEYGYDRLLDQLREHRHEDAADLHRALLDDLRSFTGHDCFEDDTTIVVLKWRGIQLAPQIADAKIYAQNQPFASTDVT